MPKNNYLYFKCIVTKLDWLAVHTNDDVICLDTWLGKKMCNSTFKYQTKIVDFYLKIYLNTVNRDDTM